MESSQEGRFVVEIRVVESSQEGRVCGYSGDSWVVIVGGGDCG